jgi:hypothetical protein
MEEENTTTKEFLKVIPARLRPKDFMGGAYNLQEHLGRVIQSTGEVMQVVQPTDSIIQPTAGCTSTQQGRTGYRTATQGRTAGSYNQPYNYNKQRVSVEKQFAMFFAIDCNFLCVSFSQ